MEPNAACLNHLMQLREISWKEHFTDAYSHSDQRNLLIESIVNVLKTSHGWHLLSGHMSLINNETNVCLDMEALLAR